MFCKKGVLRNFTGNVAGLRPGTLFKKRLWHRCFPMNFAKFVRKSFLQNTSGRLFLKINDSKQRNQAKIRSSRSKMFFKISVLENFAIFTGKHLCWSLFLIKLQALGILHKNSSFIEHLWWLLLKNGKDQRPLIKSYFLKGDWILSPVFNQL